MSHPHGDEARENGGAGLSQHLATAEETLRTRFDEPIERATALTRRTLAWFPVRVWRHFLRHNGFLLAAGVSYEALFAIFAAVYVAFASVGLWLGASPVAVQELIDLINRYIPGLISDDGVFTPEQVQAVATGGTGVLSITGLIAVGTLIWTMIGWVTYARRAVRNIFGLPPDDRGYMLLKIRDFLAALLFGGALIVGGVVGFLGTWTFGAVFRLFGWDTHSWWFQLLVGAATVLVSFAVDALALAVIFRFLSGAAVHWHMILPGALLGGGGVALLQLGAGFLLSYSPSNPLLATFAVFIGLLLWFRVAGVVLLVAAAWIAVSAHDEDIELAPRSEADVRAAEHAALLVAARVRIREAEKARDDASWLHRPAASRALRRAQMELDTLTADDPPPTA